MTLFERAAVDDEVVAALPGRCARFRDALEIPIRAAVVGIQLPVVARRVVPAVAVQRRVQVLQLGGRRVRHAVDSGADGVPIGGGVNRDRNRGVLCVENRGGGGNRRERSEARNALLRIRL